MFRAEIAQGRVEPGSIVINLNVLEDVRLGLLAYHAPHDGSIQLRELEGYDPQRAGQARRPVRAGWPTATPPWQPRLCAKRNPAPRLHPAAYRGPAPPRRGFRSTTQGRRRRVSRRKPKRSRAHCRQRWRLDRPRRPYPARRLRGGQGPRAAARGCPPAWGRGQALGRHLRRPAGYWGRARARAHHRHPGA